MTQEKQTKELEQSINSNLVLTELFSQLQQIEKNLLKSDQAKSATLDVKNQQISELNDQSNTVGAELELLKNEKSQDLSSNHLVLCEYQKKEQSLKNQLSETSKEQSISQQKAEQTLAQLKELTTNNRSLADKNSALNIQLERQHQALAASSSQTGAGLQEKEEKLVHLDWRFTQTSKELEALTTNNQILSKENELLQG